MSIHSMVRIDRLNQRIAELEAQLTQMKQKITRIVGIVQRYQPAGSPPPGDEEILVRWILAEVTRERENECNKDRLAHTALAIYQEYLDKMDAPIATNKQIWRRWLRAYSEYRSAIGAAREGTNDARRK